MTTLPLHALGGLSVAEVSPGEFQLVVSDALASGTRSYNFGAATRTAVGAASVATPLGTLNTTREIMLTASTDCYVKFGASTVSVSATDAAALQMFAGERFHLQIPAGATHYAVIQDAAAGFLRVTPVI